MEPEHEITLAYQKKIEVGTDIQLAPTLCNFQVHLQQFSVSSTQQKTSSEDAAAKNNNSNNKTNKPNKNEIYNLILIQKFGSQKGREFILATFDSTMAAENRAISLDLLISVAKPNENMKDGQAFTLRLIKKGSSSNAAAEKNNNNNNNNNNNASENKNENAAASETVSGFLTGLQITSLTAAQFIALKKTKQAAAKKKQ